MNAIVAVLSTALLASIVALYVMNRRHQEKLTSNKDIEKQLLEEIAALARYRAIISVDDEIARRRNAYIVAEKQARARYEEDRQNAKTEVRLANNEAVQLRAELRELKKEAEEERRRMLASATHEASRIVDVANARAEEIGGEALTALRDAHHLEETARAMRNLIKGYGDEYLVPNLSALDDLAEEFSHKEAGVELKTARARTRQMVREGLAANCDYVERSRKETATHFVLDAFNGKVDTILTMVKHDNFGKLEQEMKDAFHSVNHNGKAFREARINAAYLDARLAELRWAVAANELRLREREEQRQIKQAMREEEQARREYEKAMRDAEKEEKMLEKALQQARRELAAANADQKAEFEQTLKELEAKLADAEARNQRAISMAQQTRRGHVYVISNVGSFGEDVYKIGLTRRLEPLDRVKELGDASVPFEFDVHAMIYSEDAPKLETVLHTRFVDSQVNKVNSRKEFFRVQINEVRDVVDKMGLESHWTMAAEAREYRESRAMDSRKVSVPAIDMRTEHAGG